jgi:hypothetical protein
LIRSEAILGLPDYEITGIEEAAGQIRIQAGFEEAVACPHCGSSSLRIKDRRIRRLRHESWGIGTACWSWRRANGDVASATAVSGSASRVFSRACEPPNRSGGRFVRSISTASVAAGWASGNGCRAPLSSAGFSGFWNCWQASGSRASVHRFWALTSTSSLAGGVTRPPSAI